MFYCTLPDPPATFQATLSKGNDDKIGLEYSLGYAVPVKRGNAVEMRSFSLQGRAVVAYGEAITIATINGKDFILTVTKYAKTKK